MPTLTPPTHSESIVVTFPVDHVMLVAFNRPKALNATTPTMQNDLDNIFGWFEKEPELWVAVITGNGRVFCAGADLKEWNTTQSASGSSSRYEQALVTSSPHGFGALSRRSSIKPIIAAVNGGAYGGGMEITLNSDLVVTEENAKFALPEVKRGVVAAQGGIPRILRIAGHQRASELLLTGRTISAQEAQTRFGFVNVIVPTTAEVVPKALELAAQITANSPDAVQSTKAALVVGKGAEQELMEHVWLGVNERVFKGDNIKEGLRAFVEKRAPRWGNPAKL